MIFDKTGIKEFLSRYREAGLHKNLFLLIGVPVITTRTSVEFIDKIPGVYCPPEVHARLEGASDIRKEGVTLAREIIETVRDETGVHGAHLMLFGPDPTALLDVVGRPEV